MLRSFGLACFRERCERHRLCTNMIRWSNAPLPTDMQAHICHWRCVHIAGWVVACYAHTRQQNKPEEHHSLVERTAPEEPVSPYSSPASCPNCQSADYLLRANAKMNKAEKYHLLVERTARETM